jgi:hypothetical protein
MASKNIKKPTPKKSPIRIPKDVQVKIIEISPRSIFILLLALTLAWSLY